MKTLLSLLLFLCLAALCPARDIEFLWDPNPETDIKSYYLEWSRDNGTTWTRTPEVLHPTTTQKVTGLPNLPLVFRAYATNQAGLDSLPSDNLPVPPDAPGKPKGLRVKIALQASADLKIWQEIASTEAEPDPAHKFFRAAVDLRND